MNKLVHKRVNMKLLSPPPSVRNRKTLQITLIRAAGVVYDFQDFEDV
jgi:hypothetical protein